MSKKNVTFYVTVLVLCFATVAAIPAFAGSSVVGSVAGSMNATISGQPALGGSTVFAGDTLKVNDGAAVMTFGKGSRAVFGRNSEVSFSRDGESVTARLASGSVSIFQPGEERNGMQLKFDNMTIGPAGGYKTLGEVAMLGDTVVVRTKQGMMSVKFANGKTTEVPAGQLMRLVPNPQQTPQQVGSQHYSSSVSPVAWAALAVAGTAAVIAGVDISKTNTASNNAASAAAAASNAITAANAATAAASNAVTAANSAAAAAAAEANTLGCALDALAAQQGQASPYTPPSGQSCGG